MFEFFEPINVNFGVLEVVLPNNFFETCSTHHSHLSKLTAGPWGDSSVIPAQPMVGPGDDGPPPPPR